MSSCRCYIVPPHLLRGLANSEDVPELTRNAAKASLEAREKLINVRKERFAELGRPRGFNRSGARQSSQQIIPDTLLRHISESDNVNEDVRARARRDLEHLERVLQGVADSQQG